MKTIHWKILGLCLILMVLAFFAPLVHADRPSPSYKPPGPWIVKEDVEPWEITKDLSPEEMKEAIKRWLREHPRREPGGPNPRAYKRLMENEAKALAAGTSPKAMGLQLIGPAKLLVIPVEFTETETFIEYTDPPTCTITTTVTITGPLHNQIVLGPRDNNTLWHTDFSEEWYERLFFDIGPTGGVTVTHPNLGVVDLRGLTAANFYLAQSDGTYWLEGDVTPWMQVPFSEGHWGAEPDPCIGPRAVSASDLVIRTAEALNTYWQTTYGEPFPWPNWDTDGDGLVDHIMIIHAGMGEEAGGGEQGDYAIWSHSADVWPPYLIDPVNNISIGPYTMCPENIDLGVIVHEYGHDIGLPDTYSVDAGNSTGFWDLMSSGAWNGPLGGAQPAPMTLWERYVLGWADPVVLSTVSPEANIKLGQLEGGKPEGTEDGVLINLPPQIEIQGNPMDAGQAWWSRKGDLMDHTLTLASPLDLTGYTTVTLTFDTWYDIEDCWDFGFVQVSTDGGVTWTSIPGTNTTYDHHPDWMFTEDLLPGLTGEDGGGGVCGPYHEGTVAATFDLSAYAGQEILLRFRYMTDWAVMGEGWFLDNFVVTADDVVIFSDDVEAYTWPDTGPWIAEGWIIVPSTLLYPHYYLAEWRNLAGFDEGLAYAYNTVYSDPYNWQVEREPYTVPGMLLWYRNFKYLENYYIFPNLYQDPSWGAKGMILVVDSHPWPYRWDPWEPGYPFSNLRGRAQTQNATFTLQDTIPFVLTNPYNPTVKNTFGPLPAVSQFHDSQGYAPGVGTYDTDFWWEDWDASVVIPTEEGAPYWPRWEYFGDAGNPGLNAFGVHIIVEDQAEDGSWGKIRVYNDKDTFLSKKAVDKATAAPGEILTYTIILKDSAGTDYDTSAPFAYTASLVDLIPAGTTYVPGSLSFSGNGVANVIAGPTRIVWEGLLGGGPLDSPDAVITYQVRVNDDVAEGTTITNTSVVSIGEAGDMGYLPKRNEYTLTAVTTVGKAAVDLSGSYKAVDKERAHVGDTLTYTIVLSNAGTSDATVSLVDTIPIGTRYVEDSVTGGAIFIIDNPHEGTPPGIGKIVWSGTVGANDSVTITFQVTVEEVPIGTVITNQALVSGGDFVLTATTKVVYPLTILHTNDFHGNLESDYKGRGGSAYMAGVINDIRAELGADRVFLMDAGDVFLGAPPISQLLLGESTIDIYNMLEYDVAAFGNHAFDKGQDVLQDRVEQSDFPWVSANIVLEGTDWEHPTWVEPYVILSKGEVDLGVIGLTTDETPLVTLKGTTEGLEFKDLTEAVLHYYDEVEAQSDAVIVLAHMGTEDSGPYKGLVTVAQELIDAGKPADLMIGGHQHQYLDEPVWVGDTPIIVAYKYGRVLGRADVSIDPETKSLTLDNYEYITINNQLPADPDVEARVAYWAEQVAPFIERVVGYTNISLVRDYNAESIMGDLVTDGMLWKADQYDDGEVNGSVDIAFTNPGGLRADIEIPAGATLPYTITWGDTFNVMPFGNTLYLMDLTGWQIQELLDQAATLYKGILQTSGASWYWYNDCNCDTPTAWGAYGVMVDGEPLDYEKTYRVVTNNFLAGGKDGWVTFAEGTNRWDTYYDMQEAVNEYIAMISPIDAEDIPMGRITKLDKVVTILHTNDEHGRAYSDTYRGEPNGLTYLYSLVKGERAKNPNVLLMSGSDTIQGNPLAFYFRNAPGLTPGDTTELANPMMAAMNMMGYDVSTIGNHEFNFGNQTFAKALGQAEFTWVAANVTDDGRYGFIEDNTVDYTTFEVEGLKVAVLGITNPRVPSYELPSNIVGLTFTKAITTAMQFVPQILADEDPDLMVLLTHIGYSPYKGDYDRDTEIAKQVPGIDVIIGGHSHTKLDPGVIITSTVNPTGTLIAQAYKYATYLGKTTVGFAGTDADGYEIVFRESRLLPAGLVDPDPNLEALMEPYLTELNAYTGQVIGESLVDLDATTAFTEETACSNLQVDASKWALEQAGIPVDFHLSGAMSNKFVPAGTLTVGDMFTLMPYENSLVVISMNGPQIKRVLERSYWNYWQKMQGERIYTTCFLDISEGGVITYTTAVPEEDDNVVALTINGVPVDFNDADTYYNVSTVNYLAAGACGYKDDDVSIWPLDQIVADTQYYVRDSVIDYIKANTPISPQVEGRIVFTELVEFKIYLPLVFKSYTAP